MLITTLENSVYSGITEPPTHSMRSSSALDCHFSVSVMMINSLETSPSPNSRGKERKQINLTIFLKAISWRSLSSERFTSVGWMTGFSIPCNSR